MKQHAEHTRFFCTWYRQICVVFRLFAAEWMDGGLLVFGVYINQQLIDQQLEMYRA